MTPWRRQSVVFFVGLVAGIAVAELGRWLDGLDSRGAMYALVVIQTSYAMRWVTGEQR